MSRNLPPPTKSRTGTTLLRLSALEALGWQPFFAAQVDADEISKTPPVRVVEVHRSAVRVLGNEIDETIQPKADATVGDWVLLDCQTQRVTRILDRTSLIKRRAPGTHRKVQLIAANIDTVFIVSSCNQDFNVARLERYIALAFEAGIAPVIVLTKADLVSETQSYLARAAAISADVPNVILDARGDEPQEKLRDWCRLGQTVAFLGSSGVGKSTLINALAGTDSIHTQPIREDDAKGRHTTTRRQLHPVHGGCLLLDTPGMRELKLTDAAIGIDTVFADLQELADQCRFNDCQHRSEHGCAVLDAVARGAIDPVRLERWRKLRAEDAFNTATLAERRSKDKEFGKMVRRVTKAKRADRLRR